jgi:hypothetical protein
MKFDSRILAGPLTTSSSVVVHVGKLEITNGSS